MKAMSYRDLEVFQLAMKLAAEIHQMTMQLPKFELFEEGGQIRRSSKSVVHHIVEGFGRRKYRNDFLKYITVAIAECDETQVAIELLYRTESLKDQRAYEYFKEEYNKLARKLNRFHSSIEMQHKSPK